MGKGTYTLARTGRSVRTGILKRSIQATAVAVAVAAEATTHSADIITRSAKGVQD